MIYYSSSASRHPLHRIHTLADDEIKARTKDHILHATMPYDEKLRELDKEWDTEKVMEAGVAAVALLGIVLGATVNKKWMLLTGAASAILLQQAFHGRRLPLSVIRRFGFRTAEEIAQERCALKFLRGDFSSVDGRESLLDAVKKQ